MFSSGLPGVPSESRQQWACPEKAVPWQGCSKGLIPIGGACVENQSSTSNLSRLHGGDFRLCV